MSEDLRTACIRRQQEVVEREKLLDENVELQHYLHMARTHNISLNDRLAESTQELQLKKRNYDALRETNAELKSSLMDLIENLTSLLDDGGHYSLPNAAVPMEKDIDTSSPKHSVKRPVSGQMYTRLKECMEQIEALAATVARHTASLTIGSANLPSDGTPSSPTPGELQSGLLLLGQSCRALRELSRALEQVLQEAPVDGKSPVVKPDLSGVASVLSSLKELETLFDSNASPEDITTTLTQTKTPFLRQTTSSSSGATTGLISARTSISPTRSPFRAFNLVPTLGLVHTGVGTSPRPRGRVSIIEKRLEDIENELNSAQGALTSGATTYRSTTTSSSLRRRSRPFEKERRRMSSTSPPSESSTPRDQKKEDVTVEKVIGSEMETGEGKEGKTSKRRRAATRHVSNTTTLTTTSTTSSATIAEGIPTVRSTTTSTVDLPLDGVMVGLLNDPASMDIDVAQEGSVPQFIAPSQYEKLLDQVRMLQAVVRHYNDSHSKIQKERSFLREQLEQKELQIETLRGTNDNAVRVMNRNTELELSIGHIQAERDEDIGRLNEECRSLRGERDALNRTASALQSELESAEQELEAVDIRITSFERECRKLREVEKNSEMLQARLQELDLARAEEKGLHKLQVEQSHAEKQMLQDRLEHSQAQMGTLLGTNERAEVVLRRNTELERLVGEVQIERDDQIFRLQGEVHSMRLNIDALKRSLEKEKEEKSEKMVLIELQSEELDSLKAEKSALRSQLMEVEKLQHEIANLGSANTHLSNELKTESKTLKSQIEQRDRQLATLEGTNRHYEDVLKRNNELEDRIVAMQSDRESDLQQHAAELAALQRERAELNKNFNASCRRVEALSRSVKELKASIQHEQETSKDATAAALRKAKAEWNEEFERKYKMHVDELKEQLAKANEDGQMQELRQEAEVVKLRQELEEALAMANDAKLRALKASTQKGVEDLKKAELKKDADISELTRQHEETISCLRQQHQAQLQALEDERELEVKKLKSQHTSEMHLEKQNFREAERIWEIKLESFEENKKAEIQNAEEEFDRKLEAALDAKNAQIKHIKEAWKAEMNQMLLKAENLLEEERKLRQSMLEEVKLEKEREINQLTAVKSREVSDVRDAAAKEMRNLQEQLRKATDDSECLRPASDQLRQSKETCRSLIEAKSQLEDQLERQRALHLEQMSEKEKQLTTLERTNLHAQDLLRKNNELESLVSAIHEEHAADARRSAQHLRDALAEKDSRAAALRTTTRQVNEVEAQLADLRADMKRIEAENSHIRSRLQGADDIRQKLHKLEADYSELSEAFEQEKISLKREIEQRDRQLSDLIGTNEHATTLLARNGELEKKIAEVQSSLDEAVQHREQYCTVRLESDMKQRTIADLRNQIAEREKRYSDLLEEIDTLREIATPTKSSERSKELLTKIDALCLEKEALQDELRNLEAELNREKELLLERLEQKDRQLQMFTSNKKHFQELLKRNTMLEDALDRMSRERDAEYNEREKELEAARSAREAEIWSTRIEVLRSQIRQEYERLVDRLRIEGKQKDAVAAKLRQDVERLESERADDQQQRQHAETLAETVTEISVRNRTLTTQIHELRRRLQSKKEENLLAEHHAQVTAQTMEQIDRLLSRCSQLESMIAQIQEDKEAELQELYQQLISSENEKETQIELLGGLQRSHELFEQRVREMTEELENVKEEKRLLEVQARLGPPPTTAERRFHPARSGVIDDLKREVSLLRKTERETTSRLEELRSKNATLENTCREIEEEQHQNLANFQQRVTALESEVSVKDKTLDAVRRQSEAKSGMILELTEALNKVFKPSPQRSKSRRSLGASTELDRLKADIDGVRFRAEGIVEKLQQQSPHQQSSPRKQMESASEEGEISSVITTTFIEDETTLNTKHSETPTMNTSAPHSAKQHSISSGVSAAIAAPVSAPHSSSTLRRTPQPSNVATDDHQGPSATPAGLGLVGVEFTPTPVLVPATQTSGPGEGIEKGRRRQIGSSPTSKRKLSDSIFGNAANAPKDVTRRTRSAKKARHSQM